MSGLGKLTIAITATTRGLEQASRRTLSILGKMGRAATSLPGLLAVGGGATAAIGLAKTTDAFTTMAAQLEYLTGSATEAGEAQEELMKMSQKTGTSMTDNATALVRLGNASEMMGTSTEENVAILGGLNALMLKTGTSGAQASSVMLQLTQALGSGKLAGDEFRTIMENSPALMAAFAGSMGVGVGELKKLASEGKITTDKMTAALLTIAENADENIGKLPNTFSRAWNMIVNSFQSAWDKINDETGIMGLFQQAMVNIADWITANESVFVDWFSDMKDSFLESWPAVQKTLKDTFDSIVALVNKLITSGPSMDTFFQNLALSVGAAATAVKFLVDMFTSLIPYWDKFVKVMNYAPISVIARIAGTAAGGGGVWDSIKAGADFDGDPYNDITVPDIKGPKVSNPQTTNMFINQQVSRSDVVAIQTELNRSAARR